MNTPETSKPVLPFEGTENPPVHISIEVLTEGTKQIEEQLKKNNQFKAQLQKTLSDVQTQLNQVALNEAALSAQRAYSEETKRKLIELLTPAKTDVAVPLN